MTFEDDKLNREKYADFLTEIIMHSEKYKTITDSVSFNFAIDSSWGTGKTTFLEMWENKLKDLKNQNGQELFEIIHYNAWKNDFLDNPIESIIYTIVNSELFKYQNENDKIKNSLIQNGGNLIKGLIKSGTQIFAGEFVGDMVGNCINQAGNVVSDLNNSKTVYTDLYTNYNDFFKSVDAIKKLLEPITEDTPIIFIIDELDRCKPIFAIKILESIKHIFDIKNVIFVFALDMQQLSSSVKAIYGNEIDANGYLAKFFDYISKLPRANIESYIAYLKAIKKPNRSRLESIMEMQQFMIDVTYPFFIFAKSMNLSLRDINVIYSNFLIFENLELKNSDNAYAYILYIFLISLKYKSIEDYNKIFLDGEISIIMQKYFDENDVIISNWLNYISELNFLEKISRNNYCNMSYDNNSKFFVTSVNNDEVFYKKDLRKNSHLGSFQISEVCSLSGILFYDDLMKWDEIKDITLGQYIQQKLEFFNFEKNI